MALNHQSLYAMKWQAEVCPDYVSIFVCLKWKQKSVHCLKCYQWLSKLQKLSKNRLQIEVVKYYIRIKL